MSLLANALDLDARGWTVFPVRDKKPAIRWKGLQDRKPTASDLRYWFGDNGIAGGIAVILGAASNGLACRDFDDSMAFDHWRRFRPDLAARLPTVKTFRGAHVYFVGPTGFGVFPDGEYRADCRHYNVLPPSPHPKGGRYEWVIPLGQGDLPNINDPAAAGLIPVSVVNTRDSKRRGGEEKPVSVLTTHAVSVLTEPVSVLTEEIGEEEGRAIRETIPPGPGYRHRSLFDLARRLKSLPKYAEAPGEVLLPLVEIWFNLALPTISTKDFTVSKREFLDAWRRVEFPTGKGAIDRLWAAASTAPAIATNNTFPGMIGQVVRLCELLQSEALGESFFLGCRTVGRLADVSHVAAWKWLRRLEDAGIIRRVATGRYESRTANEYVLVDGSIDERANRPGHRF